MLILIRSCALATFNTAREETTWQIESSPATNLPAFAAALIGVS